MFNFRAKSKTTSFNLFAVPRPETLMNLKARPKLTIIELQLPHAHDDSVMAPCGLGVLGRQELGPQKKYLDAEIQSPSGYVIALHARYKVLTSPAGFQCFYLRGSLS